MISDKIKESILKIIMAILGAGLLISGGAIVYFMNGYYADQKENGRLRDIAYKKDVSLERTISDNPDENIGDYQINENGSESIEETIIDFDALKNINKDTAGWITACGETIDGPVVQTDNNDYYLEHRFDGSKGSVGCFFADSGGGVAFDSTVTIIYGHNRKDGSMFHPLLEYKNPGYYQENPEFTIDTPKGRKHYTIISAYYGDYEEIFNDTLFDALTSNNTASLRPLFDQVLTKSILQLSDQELQEIHSLLEETLSTPGASLVILSTCEYSGSDNRMVVFGLAAGI